MSPAERIEDLERRVKALEEAAKPKAEDVQPPAKPKKGLFS